MSILPFHYEPLMDANKYAGSKESLTANPSNGSSFTMNQPIEITVPMRQPEYVCDFKNCFVSFDITNSNGTTANKVNFQAYCGSLGLVNQQIIKTSTGVEFSNFDGYNVLAPLLLEQEVDVNWYNGKGNILFGMNGAAVKGDSMEGDDTNSLDVLHKILPLTLTGISQSYFPMASLADIVLRFKLDTVDNAFITEGTADAILDTHITLSNIVLHYDIYRLSSLSLSSIDNRLVNGAYIIDTTDWVHQQYSSPANESKYNVKIGFAKKKAKRLIMVSRSTSKMGLETRAGLMARNKSSITKVSVKLDGKTYQSSSGVEMTDLNPVDAYAQLMKNQGGLLSLNSTVQTFTKFNLDESTPTALATCGQWFHEISFENSMDTDQSASGVSIDHNNLQVFVEKGQEAEAQTVDFFIEFYNQYRLPKSTGVWEVSDPVQYSQA